MALVLGETFKHPGPTRWWATYELYVRLLTNFDKVKEFVLTAVSVGGLNDDGSRIERMTATIKDKKLCAI